MRNLIWLIIIGITVALASAWNRPRYTGPLLGEWGCVICNSSFQNTYRADGVVEYSPRYFGGPVTYATYEVDETHSPPVITTTEQRGDLVIKRCSIWTITAEGKLRVQPFNAGEKIPTGFPNDPDPMLYSRVPLESQGQN